MNDIKLAPLRETDEKFFADSRSEQWILAYGRLIEENKLQVIVNNKLQFFWLLGNIEETNGYDIIILGHVNDSFEYIYVTSLLEPTLLSPFFYDVSSPIRFLYLDPKATFKAPGKKATILAAEAKKKNGATKEIVNISVKYLSNDLPSIYLLENFEQSHIIITKTSAKAIQLGAPF